MKIIMFIFDYISCYYSCFCQREGEKKKKKKEKGKEREGDRKGNQRKNHDCFFLFFVFLFFSKAFLLKKEILFLCFFSFPSSLALSPSLFAFKVKRRVNQYIFYCNISIHPLYIKDTYKTQN